MVVESDSVHLGLPWPEAYEDLRPLLQAHWGVGEDFYLHHQLSGKSGAVVYAADIHSSDFSGQAILKLDRSPDPAWQEKSEAERHQQAFAAAPAYAAAHLPRLLHSLHHGEHLAILSSIAGRGLEFARPWAECAHEVQLRTVRQLSAGLLEDWNRHHALGKGLPSAREILRTWLGYRIDPEEGRLHGFAAEHCGVTPADASFIFEGRWHPNPLAFLGADAEAADRLRLRAVTGNIHGDLHGFNVLVSTAGDSAADYYLIDLAFYEDQQFLFYDHGYFELSHLLMVRERADAANWQSILDHLSLFDHHGAKAGLHGDDRGLLEVISALRREALNWVDRHQENRLAYMRSQYLLARIAAGLNFANKQLAEKPRRLAFLYAAANLKDFLKLNGIDWPKHGPHFEIEGRPVRAGGAGLGVSAAVAGTAPSPRAEPEHPPLPERPAIAVLAFENLTGDRDQEHFSDGVSQEIITALSRVDWLMVIARGSAFAYKGHAVDVKRIGRELGVHYVVEGSVRKAGSRLRIAVQLIDARSSHHLWAERFDRDLEDVFELQEEIAQTIAANIDSTLKWAEREGARHSAEHLGVWERFQGAVWHVYKFTEEHTNHARRGLAGIIEEAPGFAPAHALQAVIECRRITFLETETSAENLRQAFHHADRAVALDEGNSTARVALSRVLMLQGHHDRAIDQAQQAVALNPSSSIAQMCLALAHYWSGNAAEAVGLIDRSIRLSPRGPFREIKQTAKALCFYVLGELDEAEALVRQPAYGHQVGPIGMLTLTVVLARQGKIEEAKAALAQLREARPDLTLGRLEKCWGSMAPDYLSKFVQDLEAAGLPA